MLIIDAAPDAAIQEMIARDLGHWSWVGDILNPLLGADAVRRLIEGGTEVPVALACCCDPATLHEYAEAAAQACSSGSYSGSDRSVLDAVAANPFTEPHTLWAIADGTRDCPKSIVDRIVADANAGEAPELITRLNTDHRQVPHEITTGLATGTTYDVLTELLATQGGWRLNSSLRERNDFVEHPELIIAWLPTAGAESLGRFVGENGAIGEGFTEVALASPRLLDVVAHALSSGRHETQRPLLGWAASHAGLLIRSAAGARVARVAFERLNEGTNNRTFVTAIVDAMNDAIADELDDDTLAEFRADPRFAGELLKRRGIADISVWRFLLATGEQAGSAGELADLAACVAHDA